MRDRAAMPEPRRPVGNRAEWPASGVPIQTTTCIRACGGAAWSLRSLLPMNPLRALLAAVERRRLRRIAKARLDEMLRRDGVVKIHVRLGDRTRATPIAARRTG